MSALVPRNGSTQRNLPAGFGRSEGRQLQAATNREVADAIVRDTRLSVANFLTATALQHTASLARQAYALADGDEYLASRLGAIVDGYVRFAHAEIGGLRRL
jgi:hypothetical protein